MNIWISGPHNLKKQLAAIAGKRCAQKGSDELYGSKPVFLDCPQTGCHAGYRTRPFSVREMGAKQLQTKAGILNV
jgi:hypothetical protein